MKFLLLPVLFLLIFLTSASPLFAQQQTVSEEFPVAIFHSDTVSDLPTLRNLGFNLVIWEKSYPLDTTATTNTLSFLDSAQSNRLQVLIFYIPSAASTQTQTTFLNAIKNHPALYGYLLADEPELVGPTVPVLTATRDLIKNLDPTHPTYLNTWVYPDGPLSSDVFAQSKQFFNIATITSFDYYSYFTNPTYTQQLLSNYQYYLQRFTELAASPAHFAVIQSFAGKATATQPHEFPGARFPSEAEINDQIAWHQLLSQGKFSGVMYFTWNYYLFDSLKNATAVHAYIKRINENLHSRPSLYPVKIKGYIEACGLIDLDHNAVITVADVQQLLTYVYAPCSTGLCQAIDAKTNVDGKLNLLDVGAYVEAATNPFCPHG